MKTPNIDRLASGGTLFEQALHCPLIVSSPGVPEGRRAAGLLEYLDVYRTLCELNGLPVPVHVQGKSFQTMLQNPHDPGKEAVFSRDENGDSVKTAQFRLFRMAGWFRSHDGADAL